MDEIWYQKWDTRERLVLWLSSQKAHQWLLARFFDSRAIFRFTLRQRDVPVTMIKLGTQWDVSFSHEVAFYIPQGTFGSRSFQPVLSFFEDDLINCRRVKLELVLGKKQAPSRGVQGNLMSPKPSHKPKLLILDLWAVLRLIEQYQTGIIPHWKFVMGGGKGRRGRTSWYHKS